MNWQQNPPTHEQWLHANNEGYWWIKSTVPGSDGFPEFYLYEIVQILDELSGLKGHTNRRLVFNHYSNRIYCDDLPEAYTRVQWQPVLPNSDHKT